MSAQPVQAGANPAEKANDVAIDALKQVMTLASGIITVTVAFLHDLLGSAAGPIRAGFLLPLCWVALFMSILLSWMAVVNAANHLGKMKTGIQYVFVASPIKGHIGVLETAIAAQVTFSLGMVFLVVFAILNFGSMLPVSELATTPTPGETLSAPPSTLTATPAPSNTAAAPAPATATQTPAPTAAPGVPPYGTPGGTPDGTPAGTPGRP
jgi:hypothetical protein